MNPRILVMAKAPIPGLTKTRLRLPSASAASLQEALISDTVYKARAIAPVTVAGTPAEHLGLISALLPTDVQLISQPEGDLGQRMLAGARHLFDEAPGPVVILGTDAPTLSPAYIEQIIHTLEDHDISIIPSEDGGYILIGLREAHEAIFTKIDWSTERVHGQTLTRAEESGLSIHEIKPWYDVDEPEDLQRLRHDLSRDPEIAPHTAAVLKDLPA